MKAQKLKGSVLNVAGDICQLACSIRRFGFSPNYIQLNLYFGNRVSMSLQWIEIDAVCLGNENWSFILTYYFKHHYKALYQQHLSLNSHNSNRERSEEVYKSL